jgi:hypothetical protein
MEIQTQNSQAAPGPGGRRPAPARGLTLRSFVVCLVSLFLMGMWIEYEELYNTYGGPLAENSPPNSAVGVVVLLLGISAGLYRLRRRLRLSSAELVVVYSALVLAAPLMTQGMWHRLFGLVAAIPHNQDFKSYESLPSMLWPHGPNLVQNGRFEREMEGHRHVGAGAVAWETISRGRKGDWRSPVLSNPDDPTASSALEFDIPRRDARGRDQLMPGESYLFSALVRAKGMAKGSSYYAEAQADDGTPQLLFVNTQDTSPAFANPGGFSRIGANPVPIPSTLKDRLVLRIGLRGGGTLAVQDVEFFSVEAVEAAYSGRYMVRASRLGQLGPDERNSTVVRPDRLLSLAGLRYLVTGFIPLGQWGRPALAWGSLVAALFAGFLGLNVLMRKQWVEHERFTFPLTILPKNLFAAETDSAGRTYWPIFRNRVMWIGFAVALPLVLLKGLKFYFPKVPALSVGGVGNLSDFFNNPLLKAFFANMNFGGSLGIDMPFCVIAIALLIETDILFSLWATFVLFQLWNLFGKIFGLTRYAGYPWDFQQAMGAFIAYAALALFVGRHHLARVARVVAGRGGTADRAGEAQETLGYRGALALLVASVAALWAWGVWTGMGGGASLLFFGYMLVCGFAASKIRAECGAPLGYLTPYFGMQFVGALGGFAVFQSTGMLVASIAAGFMCVACFLLIAPAQVEMMELGRHFSVRPRDVGAGLTLGLLGGLFIGGFVVLCWVYGIGANNLKTSWPYEQNWYFSGFRSGETAADRSFLAGTLGQEKEAQALNFVRNPDAKGLGIGAAVTGVLAMIRAKVPGFPLHPLGYVLASSFFMRGSWYILLLAWLVRLLLLRVGGAGMIRRGLVPFAVGMFLAAIASIVIFDAVGIALRLQGVTEVYSKIP